jgi:thiamine kinase-like enzyme
MDLNRIVDQFIPNRTIQSVDFYGNGHINTTYRVAVANSDDQYILQKINTNVFQSPNNIIQNHYRLQDYLNHENHDLGIPYLLPTKYNDYILTDENNGVWRMMEFIQDSYSIEVIEKKEQAYEAGRGFGWFLKVCSGLDVSNFHEAIKDFHSLSLRLDQFNDAIDKNKVQRKSGVSELIEFYKNHELIVKPVAASIQNQEVQLRVVHNDTKINNLLFRNEKAIAVIDLDTVAPGSILYDYGDALRTICNTKAEDEQNIESVDFNLESFEYFTKGYSEQTANILTKREKELFYLAPFYMTYMQGIRFLTDYLNGDTYFKTKYSDHNLVRSLVQKRLIEKMEQNQNQIKSIITELIN